MPEVLNPILTSPVAELQDRLDHAACTSKRVLAAAIKLDLNPTVKVEPSDEFTRIIWSHMDVGRGCAVEVLTFWSAADPTPTTAVDLYGDWADEYTDLTRTISALSAAQALRNKLNMLIT